MASGVNFTERWVSIFWELHVQTFLILTVAGFELWTLCAQGA
jgi:hypothetical protein